MNRAQRRAEAASVPRALRPALNHGRLPLVEVKRAHLGMFPRGTKEGDVITVSGWRRSPDGSGLQRCQAGRETPLRVVVVD